MKLLHKFILFIFLISINVASENNIPKNYKYYLSVRPSFESSTNVNFGFPKKKIEYEIDFSFLSDFDYLKEDIDEINTHIDYQYLFGADSSWVVVDTTVQISRQTTRDKPYDYEYSFSLNRKK